MIEGSENIPPNVRSKVRRRNWREFFSILECQRVYIIVEDPDKIMTLIESMRMTGEPLKNVSEASMD